MIPAVTHHKTLTLEGKTWVYYRTKGLFVEPFVTLERWCRDNARGVVVFGTTDRVDKDYWIQPFVFADKDDAMRFKLSF